nr:hypothetical protein [Inquilinus sp. Marseille-Q2685]
MLLEDLLLLGFPISNESEPAATIRWTRFSSYSDRDLSVTEIRKKLSACLSVSRAPLSMSVEDRQDVTMEYDHLTTSDSVRE